MKKLLTFILSIIMAFSTMAMVGCGEQKGVRILSLSDSVMSEFIADNKIDGKYDVYGVQEITSAQYDFIDKANPVKTIGVSATYVVSNDLSVDQVYNITKAIWESKGSIGHTVESTMDINKALATIGNVKIHPGAAKYYKEKNITISDDRIATVTNTGTANVTIYTGGTGGTYYAFTNGLQAQLKKKTTYNYTVVGDTGGSVANLKALKNRTCNMAIVQNDTMVNAYNGLTNNFSTGAITNFSVIGEVYPEVMQIVTNDPSIKTLADLKGSKKVVSIGDVGSGVEANAVALLRKYGIDIRLEGNAYVSSDISIKNLSVAKSADGMKDETIDVFFFTSGAPASSITDLAVTLNK